jgi:hypothetical protein
MNIFTKIRQIRKLKKAILMLLFVLIGTTSFSQNEVDTSKQNKVELLKIAYITKELNLTVAESEKFWPLYNEMELKLKDNQKAKRKIVKELKSNDTTLTDEEIKNKANAIFDCETLESSIKKEYFNKISLVIGYKKAVQLLNIEQQFKRELLKRLNQQNNQGGQKKGNGQVRPMKGQ